MDAFGTARGDAREFPSCFLAVTHSGAFVFCCEDVSVLTVIVHSCNRADSDMVSPIEAEFVSRSNL